MSKHQPPTPGPWEVDSNGKRFRRVGNSIEYEPIITTTHGTLTQSQLAAMNAREKEKPAFIPATFPSVKYCPFKTGVRPVCDKDKCAWHTASGCAQKCPHPAAGRKCPYQHTACTYDCALRAE